MKLACMNADAVIILYAPARVNRTLAMPYDPLEISLAEMK